MQNPYLPPQTPIGAPQPWPQGPEAAPPPTPGGFGIRFLARIVDNVIGIVLAAITGGIAGVMIASAGLGPVNAKSHLVLSFVLTTLGSVAYQAIAERMGCASPGKLICGLRVVNQDGYGRPSAMGALVRNLGYYIDGLFFGIVAQQVMSNNEMKQRLGDKWGKTVVVHASSMMNRATLPSPALGILLAMLVRMLFAAGSVLVKLT